MDIKVLRNFIQIVESGSLTAASKKIFIAQPALSNQLKALEKEVGTTLIERNSRHLKLTDTGKLFYERAASMIMLEDSMIKEIEDCESGIIGTLKIASIPSAEVTMLEKIIPNFVKENPNIKFELYEKESDTILSLLQDGTVDIGIVRTPCEFTNDMDIFYISDEELVLAYKSGAFSLGDSDYISINDLADKPLLVINRYKDIFLKFCYENEFKPNIRLINSQLMNNIKWAEQGLGIAIVPSTAMSIYGSGLSFKRLGSTPMNTRRAIVTMQNKYQTKSIQTFLELCKKNL